MSRVTKKRIGFAAPLASFVVILVLLCGCAHDDLRKGHGDVGQFIVQQSVLRCGVAAPTNALPPISRQWRYSEDDKGVVIRMGREQFPAVQAFLEQAFGPPKFLSETAEGKLGIYRMTTKGGGIQFCYDAKGTHVIVMRPVSGKELKDGLIKATQDERFSKGITNR